MTDTENGIGRGAMVRRDFGSQEIAVVPETASTAMAAQAKAAIEARYILAMRRPRDWDDVRVKLLKECRRPLFAQTARYSLPRGGQKVEGWSVRFAEAAARCMGNLYPTSSVRFDDDEKRIVCVQLTELEANLTYEQDVTIEKRVERSSVKDGDDVLGVRTNSAGKKTYLVRANDGQVLERQNSMISRALRNLILRVLPGDLADEALQEILETAARKDREDPDASKKALADGFADLGVQPSDLREYLGIELSAVQPADLKELRLVYAALKSGETTWRAVMEERRATKEAEASTPARGTANLRAKAAAGKPEPKQEKPAEREPGAEG